MPVEIEKHDADENAKRLREIAGKLYKWANKDLASVEKAKDELVDVPDYVISEWYDSLTEFQQKAISLRYNCSEKAKRTYAEIANTLSTSKSYCRFSICVAWRKLYQKVNAYHEFAKSDRTSESISIDLAGFSVRTRNSLSRAGIKTFGQLQSMSDEELSKVKNLGSKSLAEIKAKIAEIKEGEDYQ